MDLTNAGHCHREKTRGREINQQLFCSRQDSVIRLGRPHPSVQLSPPEVTPAWNQHADRQELLLRVHEMRGGTPGSPGNLALVGPLRAAVSHVEVDNIFSVSPLHRNSKGLKGMKGKGNETSHGVADGAAQEASLDLKLEQTRVAGIEPPLKETH